MTPSPEAANAAPPPPPAAGRVFISFASEDLDLANSILASLEGAGIPCWIAHRDIGLGASYPAAIRAALESSGVILLVLSEAANRSPHVRREVEMAFNARTPILPVRMSGILPSPDLEYFLSTTQWLDAGATFDEAEAVRLREVLRALLARQAIADDGWNERRRRRRLVAVAGGALFMVLLAGLVVATLWRDAAPATDPGEAPPNGAPPDPGPPPVVATPDAPPGTPPRTMVNASDGLTYVWIPPGTFVMGCSPGDPDCDADEQPVHGVTLRAGFWMGRTEVTEAAYRRRGGDSARADGADGSLPMAAVTWMEAKAFCAASGGRLPIESEWEYAARAGTTTRFYGPPQDVAWYEANSDERPHPVGMKTPNAFGLHDMLGNVNEWVLDRYVNAYDDSGDASPVQEPLASNATAVARGGSWFSEMPGVRVSRRLEMYPDAAEPIIGFRCVRDRP